MYAVSVCLPSHHAWSMTLLVCQVYLLHVNSMMLRLYLLEPLAGVDSSFPYILANICCLSPQQ